MAKVRAQFTRIPWLLIPLLFASALAILIYTASKKTTRAAASCSHSELSGLFQPEETAYFEGNNINVPEEEKTVLASVLGTQTEKTERWIEVDLSEQKLTAWDGEKVFLETKISSGLPWWPTPTGEFKIWSKFRYIKMEGGTGKHYYYLPNVPFTMFFENSEIPGRRGYGLHGTYWHNDFGTPRSHGCVNLPTPVAKELFYWVGPTVAEGKSSARSSEDNSGTRVVIHE